ncbi:hypothetical protein BDZ89DRAFT_1114924 [Hymenopellis radicata]|nr:hypothetical protein BDZ89DRAFT_1114924 [Hymenopellis radicata]
MNAPSNVTLPPLRSLDLLYLSQRDHNPSHLLTPPMSPRHMQSPYAPSIPRQGPSSPLYYPQPYAPSPPQQIPHRQTRQVHSGVSALTRKSNTECNLRPCRWEEAEALIVVYPQGSKYPLPVPADTRAILVIGTAMPPFRDQRNLPEGTQVHPYRFKRD